MGLARSTFYDSPAPTTPGDLLGWIGVICDEFECYGYRRVGAALRHQGVVVNSKKLRRLMREHHLQPKRRRRYVVTTDSDHAGPTVIPRLPSDAYRAGCKDAEGLPERDAQAPVGQLVRRGGIERAPGADGDRGREHAGLA